MKSALSTTTAVNVLKMHLLKKRFPFSINFIINYRCNFRCKYCDSYNRKDKEMTTQQIFKMIDEFSKMGTKRLGITGGEPLLRQDIGEIIDYAKKRGIKTTITTNGSLVPNKIKELKNLDLLLVSFDGPKEVHERYRMPESYDKAINAIKIAKQHGLKVWTTTVITNLSEDNIDFIINKAKELGFKCLFQPVYFYSYSASKKDIDKIAARVENHKKIVRRILELKKKGEPIANSKTYLNYIMKYWPNKMKGKCFAGRLYCGINSNGEVAPCSLIFNGRKWPNGTEIGFKKAFEQIRQIPCKGCYCVSFVDMNLLNSYFYPEIIFNALKDYNF